MMIPNKSNFKFQELTPITGVKPYVIRFWETEFPEIAPITSDSGQKLYDRKDVEVILKIRKLLFDQKLSIPEAKLRLHQQAGAEEMLLEEEETPSAQAYPAPVRHAGESLRTSAQDETVKNLLLGSLGYIRELKSRHNW
ncbi:MAG TPA: MerR family transcriptional regulator [Bacteriovoracaceae bacterium]|nr:MerR family transcriptional regulator [Bacteriovoracaceae bacterium]